MDNAQVTQRDIDAWEVYGPKIFNCEMTGPEALARHRLERSEPVGCSAQPDWSDILDTIENAASNWRANGYATALAEVRDMANVGRALMDALPEGYHYCDCPSEVVADLQNQIGVAEIERLRAALREISDLTGEINPSNYDHDDACELNRQFCYAITVADEALKGASSSSEGA